MTDAPRTVVRTLVDYIKRLLRIEQAKAKERQGERTSASNNAEVKRSDDATAKQFDMSATTMRRELFIAATSGIEDVAAIKSEATETAQTFAKVGIYADQRIGEILRELPKSSRWKSDSPTGEVDTKADAIKAAGIGNRQAYDLQAMAANPDVVQAVLDKAEQDKGIHGTVIVNPLNADTTGGECQP